MKKSRCSFLLALVLSLLLALSVFAIGGTDEQGNNFVLTDSDALSEEEWNGLNNTADTLFENYHIPVYMALLRDLSQYGYSADDIETASEEFYLSYDLGYGKGRDGLLLLVDISERKYDLTAHGSTANAYFGAYQKSVLEEAFLDDFAEDDWYWGLCDYLERADGILSSPISDENSPSSPQESSFSFSDLISFLIPSVFIGLIVAAIRCFIHTSALKTAHVARDAANYVPSDGVRFYSQRDIHINHFVTHEHIEREHHSSGGSSDSGGFSHSSGSF